MKLFRARTCGDVYDGSGIPSVFGAIGGVVDLEFRNRVDCGLKGHLILYHVIQVDAIDHEIDGVFAAAGGVKCERSLTAKRRREEPVGWWSHRAGNE